ncbi:branched-chain amino acid ABC transporter permease [Candidatus Njordibacter sp. Uisw_039]|jgi:branched-chain amino acid transport system permease protein|uniref:branched-chain amino acid ABC transporter permease n=1 Tax=Candidatus Njordibacter sp. Uisw_039 TaxID=3230972 RepID=UPI003A3884AF|tara:strand:+ start:3775 stop:4674 length:900 start_codon:yes stop_codon:yes gene_type:complete
MDIYLASVLTNMTLIAFLALSAYLVLVVGEVSFGQQAFFGIGAYITASVTALAGAHIFWGLLAGAIGGAVCALLLGLLTIRLSGIYFAISTLCFAELLRFFLLHIRFTQNIDGRIIGPDGPEGFSNIRWIFENHYEVVDFLLLAATCLTILLILLFSLERSRIMLGARMVGNDPILAQSQGLSPTRYRLSFITLSGAVAGFGGGLFALFNTHIEPAMFGVMLGIHGLAYAIIGGLGSAMGPLLGVVLDIGLLESIRQLAAYRMIIFGGLVALLLVFRPEGIVSPRLVSRLKSRWRNRHV